MVARCSLLIRAVSVLSVLALSSRFDGRIVRKSFCTPEELSVLALSSRFDGLRFRQCSMSHVSLSVLALSSRFDGRGRSARLSA